MEKLFGGAAPHRFERTVENRGVLKEDFVRVEAPQAQTSSVAMAIFFVQTCNLVTKDANFFASFDFLNLVRHAQCYLIVNVNH